MVYRFGVLVQELRDGRGFYILVDKPEAMGVGGRSSLTESALQQGSKEITPDKINLTLLGEAGKTTTSTDAASGKGTRNMWVYAANVVLDGRTLALGAMVRETASGDFQYSINRLVIGGPATTAEAAGDVGKSSINTELEAGDGSNINLFVVPDAGKSETAIDDASLTEALRKQLEGLRLADKVKLRIVETLGGAAGSYAGGVVTVARDTAQGEPFTLNHEAIHALRDMGVLNTSEWAILSAAARRDPGLMRSIRQRYAKLSPEAQIEEAVADMFARHQEGKYQANGMVERVFKVLRQLFEAVRNVFAGRGMRTAEGVMQDVARGDVGAQWSRIA